MTLDRDPVYLADMREAAQAALEFTDAIGREAFLADKMRIYAVVRSLEVLGEAAKRVSEAAKAAEPQIPWKRVAGLRDKLIHDYGNVDAVRVWNIVEGELPALVAALQRLASNRK